MSNRTFLLRRVAWLTLSLSGLALDASAQQDGKPRCKGETMPTHKTVPILCATDLGVDREFERDQGPALQTALDDAAGQGAYLFLPAGNYIVNSAAELRVSTGLIGSSTGPSILINHTETTTVLRQPATTAGDHASTPPPLIKSLQLANVRLVLEGTRPAIVRHNVFVLTRSPLPQLQVTRGAHRLIGNVFHRRSEHPGDGIELIAVENPAATSAEASAIVRGNLIGGPLPLKPPQDSGAERNYVRQVADLPPEDVAARTGHYVTALRTVGPVLAKIQHNVIGVVSGRVKKPHVVAEFERPRSLRLAENRLLAVNASTGGRPLVIFRAPSAAKFRKNWLTGIDLWLLPSIVDPKAPTKRTGLSFNRFERSVVVIGVSVTGSGALARTREDLTTPDDVQISDNTFVATPGKCPLTMPAPYDFVDNFRELDNQDTNEESVKVCPPRTKAAPASSPSSA